MADYDSDFGEYNWITPFQNAANSGEGGQPSYNGSWFGGNGNITNEWNPYTRDLSQQKPAYDNAGTYEKGNQPWQSPSYNTPWWQVGHKYAIPERGLDQDAYSGRAVSPTYQYRDGDRGTSAVPQGTGQLYRTQNNEFGDPWQFYRLYDQQPGVRQWGVSPEESVWSQLNGGDNADQFQKMIGATPLGLFMKALPMIAGGGGDFGGAGLQDPLSGYTGGPEFGGGMESILSSAFSGMKNPLDSLSWETASSGGNSLTPGDYTNAGGMTGLSSGPASLLSQAPRGLTDLTSGGTPQVAASQPQSFEQTSPTAMFDMGGLDTGSSSYNIGNGDPFRLSDSQYYNPTGNPADLAESGAGGQHPASSTYGSNSFLDQVKARFGNQKDPLKLLGGLARLYQNQQANKQTKSFLEQMRQNAFPYAKYQGLAAQFADPTQRMAMMQADPAYQAAAQYAQQAQARKNARSGDINSGFGAATMASALGQNAAAWEKQMFDHIAEMSGMRQPPQYQAASALINANRSANTNTLGSVVDAVRSNQGYFPDFLKTIFG